MTTLRLSLSRHQTQPTAVKLFPNPFGLFLFLLGLMLLTLAGCGRSAGRDVRREIEEKGKKVRDYQVMVEMRLNHGGLSASQTTKQWYLKPNSYRVEVLSPAEARGQLSLFDGKTFWFYNEREKVATVLENQKARGLLPGQEYLMDSLQEEVLTGSKSEYQGETVLEGKPAYLFKLPGLGDSNEGGKAAPLSGSFRKIWISRDSGLPLHLEGYQSQGALVFTVNYSQLRVNQGLSSDLFTFRPPPGVRVIEGELGTELITLEEARKLASFSLLFPSYLPAGFRQTEVGRTGSAEGLTIILFYDKEGSSLSLSQRKLVGEFTPIPGARRVIYEGLELSILEGEGFVLLNWVSRGIDLSLMGNLPVLEMIKIALSVRP
ncbi:MAG: hypothetical protein M1299_07745 [Firmicutes bacterium]|nr:hypothetical protein [Bacillota bacterium]MCL5039693.1 hypothetical protein [Bacillota bacterium]